MRISLLIIATFVLSFFANASGGTNQGKITSLYVNNGWTMVHVPELVTEQKGTKNNPDSCTSNYYYAVIPSDPNYTTIHSTLLAAQIAGKKSVFWLAAAVDKIINILK